MMRAHDIAARGSAMTPDDHYIRAEQLADQAAGTFQTILDAGAQRPIDADIRAAWFAEMGVLARLAQVHATLATRAALAPAYQPAAGPYPDQPGPYPDPPGLYQGQPVPYPGQPAPAPQSPSTWAPPPAN
jgi:hypothetical protein